MELLKCCMVEEAKEILFLRNMVGLEMQKNIDELSRDFSGVSEYLYIRAIVKKKENRNQQTSIDKISSQKNFTCVHF
jgi:hypothetical protein